MKLRVYIDTSVVGGYFDDEFEDVTQLDVLVSWNFKHIVNYDKIKLFNSINLRLGYPMIEIRSPKEFV
ncbi:MAG: PIN domain protein, partial [Bacteroidetes bacterium]|nr:PIN domain protein [Bacteroidota bacterium]